MQTEEEVLERIDQGETAYDILLEAMPGVQARFNRACRNIVALLEDVRKEFPDAQYYTASGGLHLMLGDNHTFHGKPQQELIALSGSGVSISDGDF